MNLFVLTTEALALQAALDRAAEAEDMDDAESDALLDWLNEHESDLESKLNGYGTILREKQAHVSIIKAEEERLNDRRKAEEASIERMKQSLGSYMDATGNASVKTPLFTFTRAQNGGKTPVIVDPAVLADPSRLPERFRIEVPTSYKVDTDALRDAITNYDPEAGNFAQLGERGTHLRVR